MRKILLVFLVLVPYTIWGQVVVPMERQENGLYLIPCKVNGVPMKFIFDTGASTVNISMAEALFLLKNGYIQESDIKGTSNAQIANGEIVENTKILLRKIDIGGIEINDVDATVSHNMNAPLLLGQSAIDKLGTIQLEGSNLIIKGHKNVERRNADYPKFFYLGMAVVIVTCIGYFSYLKSKNNKNSFEVANPASNLPNSSSRSWITSMLVWLSSRKYIVVIAYCVILLLSGLVIKVHVDNKRDVLLSDLRTQVKNAIVGANGEEDYVTAMDFERINEIEYEEVSIQSFNNNDKKYVWNRTNEKQWNNMFSDIKHVYKLTTPGWSMVGLSYQYVTNKDGWVRNGVQEFYFMPFLICVPDGVEFNDEIAKYVIRKSLDIVYCEPNQYNEAQKVLPCSNEYCYISGYFCGNDSVPEQIHFTDKITGTGPIFENGVFRGDYWFGMHKIGPYRVLLKYRNRITWIIEEKGGFNASTKDRVIYFSIVFAVLSIILFIFLYNTKHSNKDISQ